MYYYFVVETDLSGEVSTHKVLPKAFLNRRSGFDYFSNFLASRDYMRLRAEYWEFICPIPDRPCTKQFQMVGFGCRLIIKATYKNKLYSLIEALIPNYYQQHTSHLHVALNKTNELKVVSVSTTKDTYNEKVFEPYSNKVKDNISYFLAEVSKYESSKPSKDYKIYPTLKGLGWRRVTISKRNDGLEYLVDVKNYKSYQINLIWNNNRLWIESPVVWLCVPFVNSVNRIHQYLSFVEKIIDGEFCGDFKEDFTEDEWEVVFGEFEEDSDWEKSPDKQYSYEYNDKNYHCEANVKDATLTINYFEEGCDDRDFNIKINNVGPWLGDYNLVIDTIVKESNIDIPIHFGKEIPTTFCAAVNNSSEINWYIVSSRPNRPALLMSTYHGERYYDVITGYENPKKYLGEDLKEGETVKIITTQEALYLFADYWNIDRESCKVENHPLVGKFYESCCMMPSICIGVRYENSMLWDATGLNFGQCIYSDGSKELPSIKCDGFHTDGVVEISQKFFIQQMFLGEKGLSDLYSKFRTANPKNSRINKQVVNILEDWETVVSYEFTKLLIRSKAWKEWDKRLNRKKNKKRK